MAKKKRKVNTQPWWRFLFVIYCGIMLWLLFGRSQGWTENLSYRQILTQNINLIPLQTIRDYWNVVFYRTNDAYLLHCFINLAGNVLLFIPAGWLLPKIFAFQRNFFRFFATCAGSILLIESVQLFTLLGSFDIDDVILNLAGMTFGFIVYHIGAALKR